MSLRRRARKGANVQTARQSLPFDARGRLQAPDHPARIGMVRGMPHTYEVSDWTPWGTVTNVPAAAWHRGEIVRGSQPAFNLGPNYPAWDRSDPSWYVGQRG